MSSMESPEPTSKQPMPPAPRDLNMASRPELPESLCDGGGLDASIEHTEVVVRRMLISKSLTYEERLALSKRFIWLAGELV